MTVEAINEALVALLWRHDAVFHYDTANKLWYLSGPRSDLLHRHALRPIRPEPWCSAMVSAESLSEAEVQAIVTLRGLDSFR